MKDLRSGRIFGPVTFEMSCIEWQKRGLPHLHSVIKFDGPLPDQVGEMDEWCWAEVPHPDLNNARAREQVLNCMVHKRCGAFNIASPCMQDDRNRKGVRGVVNGILNRGVAPPLSIAKPAEPNIADVTLEKSFRTSTQ